MLCYCQQWGKHWMHSSNHPSRQTVINRNSMPPTRHYQKENIQENGNKTIRFYVWQSPGTYVTFGSKLPCQCHCISTLIYSPAMASVDFFLFPQLKMGIKRSFVDSDDIIQNAMRQLQELTKWFSEDFQQLYKCHEYAIAKDWCIYLKMLYFLKINLLINSRNFYTLPHIYY